MARKRLAFYYLHKRSNENEIYGNEKHVLEIFSYESRERGFRVISVGILLNENRDFQ